MRLNSLFERISVEITSLINRITNEDNRKILAKIRNWFTAAIKTNDKNVLSVILEVCLGEFLKTDSRL
jgi:hypothetical protein